MSYARMTILLYVCRTFLWVL